MAFTSGTRIGPYVLHEAIGEGGQGTVWRASLAATPASMVALKLMPIAPEMAKREDVLRLRREAESLQALSHPSLVRCHGLVEDAGARAFGLVLDWVDGQALSVAARDPRMSQAHRMYILGHVVRALAHLHGAGFVHRDVKLNNVLISHSFWSQPSAGETVKLVDLGVVAPVGNPNPLTALGNIVGTAAYVAPEVLLRGKDHRINAEPRGDVFGFGVMGWRLLTGEHPTGLSARGEMVQFIATYQAAAAGLVPWPQKGDVEGPWGDVLCACLDLDPDRRPASCQQIVAMLDGRAPLPPRPPRVVETGPVAGDDDELPTTFKPSPLRKPAPTSAAAAPADPTSSPSNATTAVQSPPPMAPGVAAASLAATAPSLHPPPAPFGQAGASMGTTLPAGAPGGPRPQPMVAPPANAALAPTLPSTAGLKPPAPPLPQGMAATLPSGAFSAPSPPARDPRRVWYVVATIAGLVLLSALGVLLGVLMSRR